MTKTGKFTKKEKYKIYCTALAMYKANSNKVYWSSWGLCEAIERALKSIYGYSYFVQYSPYYHDMIEFYPEIAKHKPLNNYKDGSYWFEVNCEDGYDKRVTILEQAIEKTKPVEK